MSVGVVSWSEKLFYNTVRPVPITYKHQASREAVAVTRATAELAEQYRVMIRDNDFWKGKRDWCTHHLELWLRTNHHHYFVHTIAFTNNFYYNS